MRSRLGVFGLHLAASVCVLSCVLGLLYFGWYRWPGWYLARALHITLTLLAVDLLLGPTLTLIVANPGKDRRVLARDVAIIVTVQLAALAYGAQTLWDGRPLYYTFSFDRLELVQASDLKHDDELIGERENPAFAPHWYSRPRWVWARLPDDTGIAKQIVTSAIMGGADVVDMPRYFKPWQQGLPELRKQLKALDQITALSRDEKKVARVRMVKAGLPLQAHNAVVLFGDLQNLVAVFDPDTMRVLALIKTK
jgi:hypothetical protein